MKKSMGYYTTWSYPLCQKPLKQKLINWYHDNSLAGHFSINKTRELIGRKYYWPSLRKDVEAYIKGYHICLGLKAMRHKLYSDLKTLPIPTYHWKNLLINFITALPISTNWKKESYDFILVIVYRLTKIVYYKPVKITINALRLVEVIPDIIVRHCD